MGLVFKPTHFFDVGEYIEKNFLEEKEESFIRTAIGRFFYCALITIDSKLSLKGDFHMYKNKHPEEKTHEVIINFCLSKKEYNSMGQFLRKLKLLRVKADYYPKEIVLKDDLIVAKRLFIQIRELAMYEDLWIS